MLAWRDETKHKPGVNLTSTKQTKLSCSDDRSSSWRLTSCLRMQCGVRVWLWYSYVFVRLFYYVQYYFITNSIDTDSFTRFTLS